MEKAIKFLENQRAEHGDAFVACVTFVAKGFSMAQMVKTMPLQPEVQADLAARMYEALSQDAAMICNLAEQDHIAVQDAVEQFITISTGETSAVMDLAQDAITRAARH